MRITETSFPDETLRLVQPAARDGAALLGLDLSDPAERIIAAIDAFAADPPARVENVDNWIDRALPLGSLWGEQMRRVFGWQWSGVIFHDQDDLKVFGVFSNDRALAIYPFHFLFGCFEHKATVTVELAFNMLRAGMIPSFPPLSFQNVMDGVRHIVPP